MASWGDCLMGMDLQRGLSLTNFCATPIHYTNLFISKTILTIQKSFINLQTKLCPMLLHSSFSFSFPLPQSPPPYHLPLPLSIVISRMQQGNYFPDNGRIKGSWWRSSFGGWELYYSVATKTIVLWHLNSASSRFQGMLSKVSPSYQVGIVTIALPTTILRWWTQTWSQSLTLCLSERPVSSYVPLMLMVYLQAVQMYVFRD